ncbi:MAG: SCO6745 family protein [Acidimicrobiales bacterium]
MDAQAAATASSAAVSTIGSHFMLDGNTYKRGAELGFQGLDFYVTGRGGVLGDVDADVVSAAFTFWEPGTVRTLWEQGRSVMPATQAAHEFAACCANWSEVNVPDELDAGRLAELAAKVVAQARPACATIFAAWRALPVPDAPAAAAVHHLNALRELRNGLHGAAVVTSGLTPLEAVSVKSPGMAPLFGWPQVADVESLQATWDGAEERTTAAMAHAFESLDDAERDELVELAGALHRATAG